MSEEGSENNKSISPRRAVLLGHLFVNVPILTIFSLSFVISLFGGFIFFNQSGPLGLLIIMIIFLIIGFFCAWIWWSFSVPRWREWAKKSGTSEDQILKLATRTGLIWPEGHPFERTEFRKNDND